MASYTIKQSGGDFSSINAFIGDAGTVASDVGNIEGGWSSADTSGVTWNKAVTVQANDSSSKQAGRPWATGGTTYRHKVASGHAFTVSANVILKDFTIESDSTGVSDEIFRTSSNITTLDCTRMHLGFSGNTDQQDVLYVASGGTLSTSATFEQCFFFDVGRSIVDDYQSQGSYEINFNSCASYNIGANGGRSGASWVGIDGQSSVGDVNINAHNCLFNTETQFVFRQDGGLLTFDISATYCISETTSDDLTANQDSEVTTGTQWSHTWADTDQGSGDYVIMEDVTTSPYDPRLQDFGNSNNEAQDSHTTASGSGLTIPGTDIVGISRPQNTNYDIGIFEIEVAKVGGSMPSNPLSGSLGGPL